jgi:hypothetical protein
MFFKNGVSSGNRVALKVYVNTLLTILTMVSSVVLVNIQLSHQTKLFLMDSRLERLSTQCNLASTAIGEVTAAAKLARIKNQKRIKDAESDLNYLESSSKYWAVYRGPLIHVVSAEINESSAAFKRPEVDMEPFNNFYRESAEWDSSNDDKVLIDVGKRANEACLHGVLVLEKDLEKELGKPIGERLRDHLVGSLGR